jgi:hypothetical protein
VRLIQEKLTVAERRFGILVDCDNDRLDMLVAPSHARLADLGQRFKSKAGYGRTEARQRQGTTGPAQAADQEDPAVIVGNSIRLVSGVELGDALG